MLYSNSEAMTSIMDILAKVDVAVNGKMDIPCHPADSNHDAHNNTLD